jgi:hypothetical protein
MLSRRLAAYSSNNRYDANCRICYKLLRGAPTLKGAPAALAHAVSADMEAEYQSGTWLRESKQLLVAAKTGVKSAKDRLMALQRASQLALDTPRNECPFHAMCCSERARAASDRVESALSPAVSQKLHALEQQIASEAFVCLTETCAETTTEQMLVSVQVGRRRRGHAAVTAQDRLAIVWLNDFAGRYEFASARFLWEPPPDGACLEQTNTVSLTDTGALINIRVHKRAGSADEGEVEASPRLAEALRVWAPFARAYARCQPETVDIDCGLSTWRHPFLFSEVQHGRCGVPLTVALGGVLEARARMGRRIAEYTTWRVKELGVVDNDILQLAPGRAFTGRCNAVRGARMVSQKAAIAATMRELPPSEEMIARAADVHVAAMNNTSAHAVNVAYTAGMKRAGEGVEGAAVKVARCAGREA